MFEKLACPCTCINESQPKSVPLDSLFVAIPSLPHHSYSHSVLSLSLPSFLFTLLSLINSLLPPPTGIGTSLTALRNRASKRQTSRELLLGLPSFACLVCPSAFPSWLLYGGALASNSYCLHALAYIYDDSHLGAFLLVRVKARRTG